MNKTFKIVLLAIRIFLMILIIGIIVPHILNLAFKLLPLIDTTDPPKGNTTLVSSRYLKNNSFMFYLRKIARQYFSL